MSNDVNDNLIERARDLAEEITGHPSGYDKTLLACIDGGDLDELHRLVKLVEADLARDYFYGHNIVVEHPHEY